jgi:hypothetical protein
MNQPIIPRFRAVLNGVPDLERAIQCFGESSTELAQWAEGKVNPATGNVEGGILRLHPPSAYVTIYERFEVERSEIRLVTESPKQVALSRKGDKRECSHK